MAGRRHKGAKPINHSPEIPPTTLKNIRNGGDYWLYAVTAQFRRPMSVMAKKTKIPFERLLALDHGYDLPTLEELELMAAHIGTTADQLDAARKLSPLTPGDTPR